jgi:outer membrane protein OmpA-like peptidoglycan-associated protein
MIESLDDALEALIREVASPLAKNLGETEQATERGLRAGVIGLVETLQRQFTDFLFFDTVIELADYYRRTNGDAIAETYFSPASIEAGDSLVYSVFGANRANLADEISRATSLQPHAAACVLNVAAVLLLKSLVPDEPQDNLEETSSQSEVPEDVSRHSPPQPSGEREFMTAESTNADTPDRKKIPNAKLSWFLLAAATISITGLTWRFGRDTHSGRETSLAPMQEPSLSTESALGAKPVQDTTSTQAREAPVAPKEEAASTELSEAMAKKAHDDVPLTPEAPSAPAKEPESTGLEEANSIMKPANNAGDTLGDIVRTKLPNGVELNTSKSGVEAKLLGFLEDGSQESGEFILDGILFAAGSKTLKSSSREQLKDLAKIMKAYPTAKIVINSYTDNLGEKTHNVRLSRERADHVLRELARIGVDKSRMTAKGFGNEHPVASNNSEEGRMQNRRISLYVTRK